MLHEVLLALMGCTGDLIIERNNTFEVSPLVYQLHETERELINRIAANGYYCMAIESFIQRHTSGGIEHPLYLRALCTGLEELLDGYRQRILSAEEAILTDPSLPLTFLPPFLGEYPLVLPVVHTMLRDIEMQKLGGGALLTALHERAQSGTPAIRAQIGRLLFHCHRALFSFLSAWLLYGRLADRFGEFFVREIDSVPASAIWSGRFALEMRQVPPYISGKAADTILFIGKAVRVLQQTDAQRIGAAARDVAGQFGAALFRLRDQPEFHPLSFELEIGKMRVAIAQDLYQLVMTGANLRAHLRMLKGIFLLAMGDFFQSFIEDSRKLMQLPPGPLAERQIGVVFQGAAQRSGADEDALFRAVSIRLDRDLPARDPWLSLYLDYKADFPVDMLITPDTLVSYNTLFRFLFAVKRVQVELNATWARLNAFRYDRPHGAERRADDPELGPLRAGPLQPVHRLRQLMGYIIDNLQYYLQVDVLDTQFSILLEKISASPDFEAVKQAHEEYLSALLTQCFLRSPVVSRAVDELLVQCTRFVQIVAAAADAESIDTIRILELTQEFERQATFLLSILGGVKNLLTAPYLAQLLLRIDYNKYWSDRARAAAAVPPPPTATATATAAGGVAAAAAAAAAAAGAGASMGGASGGTVAAAAGGGGAALVPAAPASLSPASATAASPVLPGSGGDGSAASARTSLSAGSAPSALSALMSSLRPAGR